MPNDSCRRYHGKLVPASGIAAATRDSVSLIARAWEGSGGSDIDTDTDTDTEAQALKKVWHYLACYGHLAQP